MVHPGGVVMSTTAEQLKSVRDKSRQISRAPSEGGSGGGGGEGA